jgi:hypothetical protein
MRLLAKLPWTRNSDCRSRSQEALLAVCSWHLCLGAIHGESVGHQKRDRRIRGKARHGIASRKGRSYRSPVQDKASVTSLVAELGFFSSFVSTAEPSGSPITGGLPRPDQTAVRLRSRPSADVLVRSLLDRGSVVISPRASQRSYLALLRPGLVALTALVSACYRHLVLCQSPVLGR